MAVLLIAGFMNLIDVTIVNVALPSMQQAFSATSSQIQWVVAAYILAFALGLLPAGRLGDIIGRREMFIAGVAVFTLGSALCGLAPSIETLVLARVVQAAGGAMMTPQTLAIVPALFAPHERGAAQLVPVALLGNRNFMIGTGLAAVLFSGVPSFFLVLAIYLQSGFGLSPLQSGMTTLPFSVGVLIASVVAGLLGPRWQRQRITLGALLLMTAMLWLRVVVGATFDTVDWVAFAAPLLIGGLGLGTAISPMFQTVLSNVSGGDTGSASGALQSVQQVGAALGVAIIGEVFFSSLMGSGGAVAPHLAYAAALRIAVLCAAASFGSIALLVWLLPKPVAASYRLPSAE